MIVQHPSLDSILTSMLCKVRSANDCSAQAVARALVTASVYIASVYVVDSECFVPLPEFLWHM